MSSNTGDNKTGGASIIPSARPSIHSHSCCPFAYIEAMGRFGIKDNRRQEQRPQPSEHRANLTLFNVANNQGTDEVDNAFSKMSHPISPSSFIKNKRVRTQSWDEDKQPAENDSSNILSQSLPATLLQHSYCSDDSEVQTPLRQEYQYSDTSYQSATLGTPQNRTPGLNRSNLNRSQSLTPVHNVRPKPSHEGSSRITIRLLLLAGLLVTVGSMFNPSNLTNKVVYDEARFYNDINQLGMKYRIKENAVLQMQLGIARIYERHDTGSFMFVYNSNLDNFNLNEFNNFVNDVSVTASKYLRNQESIPGHYTLLEGRNLDMVEHSELINTFRNHLDKTGVMLVKHVEAIPSALAMAFHYYCDEYNPLVKKSAVFFTLNLAKCPEATENKSTHAVIEKCLAQKWDGVPADSIGPLLTRVVNVVIDVTGAF